MILHEIHDLSNDYIISMLKQEFSKITDEKYLKNYHPNYLEHPGNIFKTLAQGRYIKGAYYVAEKDNKYVCSGGWHEYELDNSVALMLTRLYIAPEHRTKNYAGTYLLPKALSKASGYKHIWMTTNEYNKGLYAWFDRALKGKQPDLFHRWPEIYRKFVPIGKRNIYYTEQYVVEYQPNAK